MDDGIFCSDFDPLVKKFTIVVGSLLQIQNSKYAPLGHGYMPLPLPLPISNLHTLKI